jgi:hypothetical protein
MEKRLVLRGVAAGGSVGLLAFLFAPIMTEPVIQSSIDYENGRDAIQQALRHAAGLSPNPPGPEIFSRGVQRNAGIGIGLLVFGMAMGGLFAIVYALAHRRYGDRVRPRVMALVISGAGFLAIYMVPYLKYPANPPAIGHHDTIHARGLLYLGMVAVSIVSMIAAVIIARKLYPRIGGWNGTIVAAAGFVVWMAIVMAIFPELGSLHSNVVQFGHFATETPQPLKNTHEQIVYAGFPADVLFRFRLYSVISQLILWTAIGLGFGFLAERMFAPARDSARSMSRPPVTVA